MATSWRDVDEAEVHALIRDVIQERHEYLASQRIRWIWRDSDKGPWERGGRKVLGKTQTLTGQAALLAHADVVVTLCHWSWQLLDDRQQTALIDHELTHLVWDDETGELTTRPHDIEEFGVILDRYGLWRSDLENLLPALKAAVEQSIFEFAVAGGAK